jgi:hypothetical protein
VCGVRTGLKETMYLYVHPFVEGRREIERLVPIEEAK